MICQNCGNQLDDNASFCTQCGSMVSTPQPMEVVNEIQPESVVENTKQKKNGIKIGIIIGAVVALLLLVVVIVLMVPKKETNDRGKKEKETKEYEYDEKGYWDEYEKDDRGNLIQGINYDEDDYEVERCEWEYDEDDNVIIERKYSYLEDKNVAGFCEYDGGGDLLKEAKYSYDAFGKIKEYDEYDAKGNNIKELIYEGEDNIVAWTEWEYDELGNITKVISCSADGTVGGWIEYAYDNDGRRIQESTYDSNGHIEVLYDDFGNKIKEERYNSSGELTEWDTYIYDVNGNCLEKIYYGMDGMVVEWYSWEYDTEGHRIKENIHHPDGNLAMGYEYDTQGNQIRIIDYDEESGLKEVEAEEIAGGENAADMGTNNGQTLNQLVSQKYMEIINQYEIEHKESSSGEIKYNLVKITDDNVPELVVNDQFWYSLNLYTIDEGTVYQLMDDWYYGAGDTRYMYAPRKGLVLMYSSHGDESFGEESGDFYRIENNNKLEWIYRLVTTRTTDDEDQVYQYFINDNEVSKEQYDEAEKSVDYDFQMLEGIYSLDEIKNKLNHLNIR